jgi:hypothetical protein
MTSLELPRRRASDFLSLNRRELRRALAEGHPVDPLTLDDTEYKGTSVGLPGWVERLTWKKFKKVFHRDPETGLLRGWNVRLEQNALEDECIPLLKRGEPFTFGHYVVRSVDRGLLIDYGFLLRDPIVCVNEGDPKLLLGWTYLDFGWFRIGTPSFFTLEYDGPLARNR